MVWCAGVAGRKKTMVNLLLCCVVHYNKAWKYGFSLAAKNVLSVTVIRQSLVSAVNTLINRGVVCVGEISNKIGNYLALIFLLTPTPGVD
jgi:hypothetical protein